MRGCWQREKELAQFFLHPLCMPLQLHRLFRDCQASDSQLDELSFGLAWWLSSQCVQVVTLLFFPSPPFCPPTQEGTLPFSEIPKMAALPKPSVLITKALMDREQDVFLIYLPIEGLYF